MIRKKVIFLFAILICFTSCFLLSFHISYKKFSKESYSKNCTTVLSSNIVEKKQPKEPKKVKEIKKDIPINYTHKDYLNKLKELNLYQNIFNDENLNFRHAVLHFQSSKNLCCDGIIGKDTRKVLMNETSHEVKDKLPNSMKHGHLIIINKDKRILSTYINGNVYKKYPIAAGANSSYTPEGKFTIASKLKNPTWISPKTGQKIPGGTYKNPLGKRWLGLSINGGSSYGIHGNCNPYSIGTNASLGCIRMFNSDVVELSDYIPINCPVIIGTSKKLKDLNILQP